MLSYSCMSPGDGTFNFYADLTHHITGTRDVNYMLDGQRRTKTLVVQMNLLFV